MKSTQRQEPRGEGLAGRPANSAKTARDQGKSMQAIVQERYGQPTKVLRLREVDRPTPAVDEVLIQVHASSVAPADWIKVTGRPYIVRPLFGLFSPRNKIPGSDVAGRVEAVGPSVTRFRPGDEVYGEIQGAYAEYATASEKVLALKPASLAFEEAAAVPVAAMPALQGLRAKGRIQSGDRVLINGASGGVGTFAIQIAKAWGAEVTAVCRTRNLELVRSLGADHTVDYTREDFTATARPYDLILDLVGDRPLTDCRRALKPGGVYVSSVGQRGGRWLGVLPRLVRLPLVFRSSQQHAVALVAKKNAADLVLMGQLIDAKKVTPVIDRRYTLSQAPAALQRQGDGHARGKSVIIVGAELESEGRAADSLAKGAS